MKFSEIVRLLERNGFEVVKEKGAIPIDPLLWKRWLE
jgi:hypothetical protein